MSKTVKDVWREIDHLAHKDLFLLIMEYDAYVIKIADREDGSVPVCVPEFFENEFQGL